MKSASEIRVKQARPALVAYLSCIRYPEVILLQGSPLLGVAFALHGVSVETAVAVAVFAAASFLLVAHIWTFNDWAGVAADLNDPNRSDSVFSTKGVSARGLLRFSLSLLLASLALFAVLPHRTLLIAVIIAALGVLYSHPALHAKSVPVLSSLPHLLGGLLHFLLGYSLFDAIDRRGVLIALFFALTFTAGHLNQEVRDHEGDRLNRLSTNAVFFGKRRAFLAGLALFTLAYADLVLLAWTGVVPAVLGVLPLLLFPVQLVWSVSSLRGGLSFESISRLQRGYRLLFGLIGLAMVAALFFR
jgi:4-hydroxybenzoate polyprenyltransferase